jgi:hypothetical protein
MDCSDILPQWTNNLDCGQNCLKNIGGPAVSVTIQKRRISVYGEISIERPTELLRLCSLLIGIILPTLYQEKISSFGEFQILSFLMRYIYEISCQITFWSWKFMPECSQFVCFCPNREIFSQCYSPYLENSHYWEKFSFNSSPLVSYSIVAMTWRPSSSVSKACFVTAGAISMNLGVRIPLGNAQVFFWFSQFDIFYGLQAAIL